MTPTSDAQSPLERWLLGLRPVRAVIANAFRIEDRVRLVRVKLVRKRGYLTVLEPYTGYGSTTWVRALARVHMAPPGNRRRFSLSRLLRRKRRESVVRGWRSFARVSAGNVPATVIIDGVRHPVKADRGGIVDINLPANLAPGWNTITFESFDRQTSEAPVFIVADDQRVGLLSDIDDTVMVTALPRPMLAAWNTFVLDVHARTPTPGMSVLAERILTTFGRSETPVVYLSTGPWNVAPTLARFLGRNLYPAGPLLLTDWGPTPERIFRSGLEHKVSNLDRLAREFPDIKWILVGDDGQHDEQIYGEFTSRHPDRVLAIAIRQLSTSEAVLAGGRAASAHWRKNAPVPWVYAPDGAGLAKQLTEGGIIPDLSQAPGKAPDETR